jgi:hypothetical protein
MTNFDPAEFEDFLRQMQNGGLPLTPEGVPEGFRIQDILPWRFRASPFRNVSAALQAG